MHLCSADRQVAAGAALHYTTNNNQHTTGNWSFAFKDYHELNFTGMLDDASTAAMMAIVDPYADAYLQRYPTVYSPVHPPIYIQGDRWVYPHPTSE